MYEFITLALCTLTIFLIRWILKVFILKSKSSIKGPMPLPIIGNLHLLGKYSTPFEGFTALSKVYGDIYSMYLGSIPCVVVNNFSLIKEVLVKKGTQFGGRPDYVRYHRLFGGDRNNCYSPPTKCTGEKCIYNEAESEFWNRVQAFPLHCPGDVPALALCDWSDLQKMRRHIARIYCSPKFTSYNYQLLTTIADREMQYLLKELVDRCVSGGNSTIVDLKSVLLAACANMFTQYMCTTRFPYDMESFRHIVRYYDEVFWDINQGYAVDFLPWLSPLYSRHMNKLAGWAAEIRKFVLKNVVEEHLRTINYDESPRDFTDALLQNLREDKSLNWNHILFELEDFLGGHSAVGNLVLLTLVYLLKFPTVLQRIREEISAATGNNRNVGILDKSSMAYTEATIFETLRFTSSPIVPHVATEDTELEGHFIAKGTCVILNNYQLNKNPQYWDNPTEFRPERFVKDGKVIKPAYFIPFGTGKRTCIGQQLVNGFSFVLIAGIVQHFDFENADPKRLNTPTACVALRPDAFPMILRPKTTSPPL